MSFRCILFALLLASPLHVRAFSYVMPSDEALLQQSEGALLAEVEARLPAADGARETLYRLRVLEPLLGRAPKSSVLMVLPGSFDAPNINLPLAGIPRIEPGSRLLLFYSHRADGALQPQQASLGVFGQVVADDGAAYYVRYLEGSTEYGKRSATRRYHAPRDAAGFTEWLRGRARGEARPARYLRPQIELAALAKYTFDVFNFPQPGPGRWFQFDLGQSLPWSERPGGQAGASGSTAALQQALSAWTSDPGSRIQLSYSGTQGSSPVCSSGSNPGCFTGHVLWNDPDGQIGGSFSCSEGGVLGLGGSLAFSNGQSFNGQTWYPRGGARITIQDGAGCFMNGSGGADGAELLTHEVGHTLAFGHSCGDSGSPSCSPGTVLDEATMRAFAHGDGRGAVLGVDDRAGAAVAYPMPPGSDTTPPTVPAGLSASASGASAINLSWSASTDSGGSGLSGYRIERCQGAACSAFVQIGTDVAANYSDSGLSPATYRYRVRAVDGAGNFSGYSGIAEATLVPAPCNSPCVFRNGFE